MAPISLPFPVIITPGSSTTHSQSFQFPPLLNVNHFRSLPSALSITPGSSSPLVTVNHCGSLQCQSLWVHPLYTLLLIAPGPSTPHCQSHRVPPLLTVNHPMSLPSLLSITPGPSTPTPTVSHPGSFPSPVSITMCPSTLLLTVYLPGSLPSAPHCHSPRVPPLPFQLSITLGQSTSHCKSHQVPPILSLLSIFPGPSPLCLTVNHPGDFSSFTVNHLGSLISTPYCQSVHVFHIPS